MSKTIDFSKVASSGLMQGEDEEDTRLLRQMLRDAQAYLSSFPWCAEIRESFFGLGVGGVVGVFLFRIAPSRPSADEWVWVVVGDLPNAYICVDAAPNPACALDAYIGEMEKWVEAASEGKEVEGLIPVNADATPENARALKGRLDFLDEEILSRYSADLLKP